MALGREEVTNGMIAEYETFSELIRSLSDEEWQATTRCDGWRVADVAAHVAGILDDVVHFRLDDIGTPESVERQVGDRKGWTQNQLADELDQNRKLGLDIANGFDDEAWTQPSPAGTGTLGFGVEGLWYDTYVHAEDIRAATGRPSERNPQSLRASVSHLTDILTDQGYAAATLALDGVDGEFAVSGGGDHAKRITGDPHQFVLVATGRAAPETLGLDDEINVYRAI